MNFNEPFAKVKKTGFLLFGGVFGAFFLTGSIVFITKLQADASLVDLSSRLSMVLFALFVLIGLSILVIGLFLLQLYARIDEIKDAMSSFPQGEGEHDKGF